MPGIHTFNDGSTLLDPVAAAIGVTTDRINLVACMVLSIPLAIVYNKRLANAETTIRQLYPAVIGISFCYFLFGSAIKHLLANILGCYAILHISPTAHVHRVVFIFALSYLTWVHFYRWQYLDTYTIDVTGAFMVVVQKVTTLAFSLHDGKVKKESELSELQKREAVRNVPPFLAYISYLLHFQTVLTGPLCFYTDWIDLTEGTHVQKNSKGELPSPMPDALVKMLKSLFFVLVIAFIEPHFPLSQLDRTDMNPLSWVILFWFTIMLCRFPYYFAWYFADGVYNLSGFGFNGYDEKGNARWDLVTNVHAFKEEMAQSFKEILDNWNLSTMAWLRRVAFDRAPKKYRTISTYALSSLWHGLFPGYYFMFSTGALFTLAGKGFRRSLRWRFLSSPSKKFAYDVFTFIGAKLALAYIAYPFVVLHFAPSFAMYKRLYFAGHLIALIGAVILPLVLPPPREKKNENGVNKEDIVNKKSE